MHQTIHCPLCGAPITAHYELFAHVHCASAPPRLEDLLPVDLPGDTPPAFDLQAEKRKLMERLERITAVVRAGIALLGDRVKGLKPRAFLT